MWNQKWVSIALTEWAGSLGPNNNGLTPGAFRWKMFNTFGYTFGPAALSLQWQHLPSADAATNRVAPGSNYFGAPAYDLFNLSGTVKINDHATVRFGVDNLFDKAPPLASSNYGFLGSLHDAVGRFVYFELSKEF